MEIITITNLKGGSGKTTTAAYLAHALRNNGGSVVCIDADPQGSLLRWAQRANWEIPVKHLPSDRLDRQLAGIIGNMFGTVIIDTPPDDITGIARAALRAATSHILIPLAPTRMEVERLYQTYQMIEEEHAKAPVCVLLNRVKGGTLSGDETRAALTSIHRHVLQAQIPHREPVAQALGEPVDSDRGFYGYTAVALELQP